MFNFKKIASVLASTVMLTSTVALAAAANYPTPFVSGGAADVAIVYGSHSAATVDLVGVLNIQDSLNSYLTSTTGTTTSTTVTGGDYVLLAKPSDNLNLGNTFGVFSGSVTEDNLKTLLADETYTASDNDEFAYEQKINLGSPGLQHFRDSDYESLVGLSERTPIVGFKMPSSTWVLNYTIDFSTDAESDIASSTELEDIEGSTIKILGKDYYVSDAKNGSGGANKLAGKWTLLDSAVTGTVNEGETVTKTVGDKTYEVSINSLTTTNVKFTVNGQTTTTLAAGESYKLSDGTYIGVKTLYQRDVSGVTGNVEFSLGSGKLEITSGSDIKLNDDTITGVKTWIYHGTDTSATVAKIDKIEIEWKTDDEYFLTPESELTMPGFEAVKFSMNDLIRPTEEKITIEGDGDTSIKLVAPIKDGNVDINLLFANSSGEFIGAGKSATERLATSEPNSTTLEFYEQFNGAEWHEYFVASYNISSQAESYLLKAKNSRDSSNRNVTTISKYVEGSSWTEVCKDKTIDSSCTIGSVSLTLSNITYTADANRTVTFTAGTNVNFQTLYTAGGLRIFLPFAVANSSSPLRMGEMNVSDYFGAPGGVPVGTFDANWSVSGGNFTTGHDPYSFWLFMDSEDKDDAIGAGPDFNVTIDDNTDGELEVSQINNAGSGGPASGLTGVGGLEVGSSTGVYEVYINGSDVAPRILHYTKVDKYAEVYYPAGTDGKSETYAEVFLTEAGASLSGGGTGGGGTATIGVPILDSEVSSASGKNLIVVGGSCVNSVAASLLGSSTPLCGADWETATGVSSGQYLIQTFERTGTSKVATLVAGYNAGDTQNAAKAITTQKVDTTAGKKYTGTTATSLTAVTESA